MTNQPTPTVEVTGWVRSTRTNCRSPGNTEPLSISDCGTLLRLLRPAPGRSVPVTSSPSTATARATVITAVKTATPVPVGDDP
jgi:hypothetical protein